MNITSINEINRLKSTISKVDQEISRRRTAIKRNMVRNGGIATRELQQMELQNNQRKAYLHVNRGQIEAIYKTSRQYNTMKTSFITPDGPKHRGNRRSDRERRQEIDRRRTETRQNKFTVTKKQRKKNTPPPMNTITIPKPVVAKPVAPRLPITKVTDAIRQQTHIAAKQKSLAIKKGMDAKRDAELVKQGKVALVAKRRQSEMEKQKREMAHKLSVARRAKVNDIKTRAISSTKSARTYAQKRASSRFRSMRPSVPTFRSRNTRGIIPLALTMTVSDKRRAASINKQVRTKETPVTQTAKEHLTEDIRQAPVVAKTTHSKEYYTMLKNIDAEKAMTIKMIEEASRDPMATELLGNERVQYWRNRAFSLVGQVEQMFKNELVRWDQGALSAGVAISTDNRSQSMRKMSVQEFNNYIHPKKMQMIEPFMKEAEEEFRRAITKQAEIKKQKEAIITARNRNITIQPSRQLRLSGIDNHRRSGRPVLSEQQGTSGLAGLFPALRSSMQGALKR